jgi:hypothetical protein
MRGALAFEIEGGVTLDSRFEKVGEYDVAANAKIVR